MAEKASSVVLNFKMDGQVKYAETLKQINSVMNVAAKEYKNHIASMGKDGSATEKLSAEKKKLEIQMEGAQKRTKMLSDEFESMSKDTSTTTEQLTKMQGKLLDSERAEIALDKSLIRVNEGLSDQAIEARDAQKILNGLKEETKRLEVEQKNLTSTVKLQKSELGENATEIEKAEFAQKQLADQTELTDRIMVNLEDQLDASKRAYGENSTEVMQLKTQMNDTKTSVNKLTDSLDDVEASTDNAGDGMEGLESKLNAQALFDTAEALQGVADKLIEIGKASFDSALQFGDSQTYLQANLGLTEDQAEKLNTVVQNVFKNGVVDSVEEAAGAVSTVKNAFNDLNDIELEELTNQLSVISKRTGTDVVENTNSAKKMMEEFGLTSAESMNLLAYGYQNNLNKADDFTDTINEYAPLFEEAGFSGEEMFKLLSAGMENGARNSDLVADAVKEMQIRFGDGSFEKNLESFSGGTGDLFKQWQNGKATMSDVFQSISKDMEGMSPAEQQAALSSLSTQFEDLGIDASLAILGVNGEMEDLNGTADEMSEKNPTEKLQAGLRELQEVLAPAGEKLVEFAIDTLPKIISAVETVYDWFTNLSEPIQTFLTSFGGLTAILIILSPIIATVAAAFALFGSGMIVVIAIIIAVVGVISGIIAIVKNLGSITDWVSEKWNQFSFFISEIFNTIMSIFNNALNWIDEKTKGKFKSIIDAIRISLNTGADNIKLVLNFIKDTFKNSLDFLKALVTGDFKGMWQTVKNQMNNIKDTVGGIWGNIMDFFKGINLWEIGKEIIGGFINGFKSMKIPTPHFSVSGDLDLNPVGGMSVPSVKVKWNAKGGIFNQPTIFGASGGQFQGIGEAGPEAALPLNEQTLGAIGRGIAETMGNSRNREPVTINNHFGQLNTNSPSELAKLDRRMKRSADFGLIGKGGVPV